MRKIGRELSPCEFRCERHIDKLKISRDNLLTEVDQAIFESATNFFYQSDNISLL